MSSAQRPKRPARPATGQPAHDLSPTTSHRWVTHATHCDVTHKVRFRDELAAKQALVGAAYARSLAEAADHDCRRHERRAYPCNACGGWHLTSRADWA